MQRIADGGPAFPSHILAMPEDVQMAAEKWRDLGTREGLTVRDYFAAAWLANKHASYDYPDVIAHHAHHVHKVADTMLAERAKEDG